MKKILAIALVMLYLLPATGATVHFHYCMGKLAEVSLALDAKEPVSCCGSENTENDENGCCDTEQVRLSVDEESGISQTAFEPSVKVVGAPSFFQTGTIVMVSHNGQALRASDSSPPPDTPLFLQYSNIRC